MSDKYLGDGVYASFDGYQVWLAANHHRNKVIALDPQVLFFLLKYAGEMMGPDRVAPQLRMLADQLDGGQDDTQTSS